MLCAVKVSPDGSIERDVGWSACGGGSEYFPGAVWNLGAEVTPNGGSKGSRSPKWPKPIQLKDLE